MRLTGVLALLFLSACVSNGTHEAVVAERDALAGRLQGAETKLRETEAERDRLKQQVSEYERKSAELGAAAAAARVKEARAALGLTDGQKLAATLKTTAGDITCELWPDVAPMTVQNFVELAEGKKEWEDPVSRKKRKDPLYDGTIFHRVIPRFMIQGGDPKGDGTGGPGYNFEDEVRPDVTFDKPGLLAMANRGPGTNGSQFFITDSTPHHLDMKHTIFGHCGNPDVLKAIINAPTQGRDRPVDPVRIEKVVVQRG